MITRTWFFMISPEKIMFTFVQGIDHYHSSMRRLLIELVKVKQWLKEYFIPAIRLRVFLTSRPELSIRLGFLEIANHDYQDLVLHI
jgi:hypothetical protein